MAAKPDAVLIAGSGTPAALPQKTLKERGYKGKIYQTHGVANNDFLRVGGKESKAPSCPPARCSWPTSCRTPTRSKKSALAYVERLRGAYGEGSVSTFGGHAWDAGMLLPRAVPEALKKAQPGTPEFRAALRDALENIKNVPARTASST